MYYCDCSKHCKFLKKVSKGTYYRHSAYRRAAPVQTFDQFAAGITLDTLDGARTPSTSTQHTHPRNRRDHRGSTGPEQRAQSGTPPRDNRDQSVGRDEDLFDPPDNRSQEGSNADQEGPQREENHSIPPQLHDWEPPAMLEELKISQEFVSQLRCANLDDSGLDLGTIDRLRHPIQEPVDIDNDTQIANLRFALKLFVNLSNASRKTYEDVRQSCQDCYPDLLSLPSHYTIQKKVQEITGVVPLKNDMCPNSCLAYTGPYKDLEECPKCAAPRYQNIQRAASDPDHSSDSDDDNSHPPRRRVPSRQFYTIPLGPQLQAQWRDKERAKSLRHRRNQTTEIFRKLEENNKIENYEDIYHGAAYLDAVKSGKIKDDDMVLLMSIDGAQLYESKQSDCWIYIWIILDHSPDVRYKKSHVLPGGFIPGPNNPKVVDSFLFPGLYHVVALMREGLRIWDANEERVFTSYPFHYLNAADGPGMTYLDGLVGHTGRYGCRFYCPVKGRHKEGGSQYYPALLKPLDYSIEGCDHEDVSAKHLPSGSPTDYKRALGRLLESSNARQHGFIRLETGISKPSIFNGFPEDRILPVPQCFAGDLMHLCALNIPDLMLGLWRGTIDCDRNDDKTTWDWVVLTGDIWKAHGKLVAQATPFLPGSFDRPPRNPAEKINSGYKAWEFLTYFYGLGPTLFRDILPEKYWIHYCKLVRAVRIVHQKSIPIDQLKLAHGLFVEFVEEFELLYYQRKACRIHFCRQSLHALLHTCPETVRVGPGGCYGQWAMERTIGNLGEEVKLHSNPYANLSQRGLRRSQINAMIAMIPELFPSEKQRLPQYSKPLGDGFVLMRARDLYRVEITGAQGDAIKEFLSLAEQTAVQDDWNPRIYRWARLLLPNGQVARCNWKESVKEMRQAIRRARMVMVRTLENPTKMPTQKHLKFSCGNDSSLHFAEVQFYFQAYCDRTSTSMDLALVSRLSPLHHRQRNTSSGTLFVYEYLGNDALEVINLKTIHTVVGAPLVKLDSTLALPDERTTLYIVEKIGLEIATMSGMVEEISDSEE